MRRKPRRYRLGRLAALVVSVAVTVVSLLGGMGVLRTSPDPAYAADAQAVSGQARADVRPDVELGADTTDAELADAPASDEEKALPANSGEGRRAVFSIGAQRVWLVGEDDEVLRTYLVSGSLTDNLEPGTYEVYSRSADATGIDDSGAMKWFVRFTRGPSGAAIGFHSIPVDEGEHVQTTAELGTPQSSGCIRQAMPDARAMWRFAPLGTRVDVLA